MALCYIVLRDIYSGQPQTLAVCGVQKGTVIGTGRIGMPLGRAPCVTVRGEVLNSYVARC